MVNTVSGTTVITSLYDIGREKLVGKNAYRSFSKYLTWFKYVLYLNVNMVIIIPSELKEYVLEHRPKHYNTKIIIRKFEDLIAYKYLTRIQSTINSMILESNSDNKFSKHFTEYPEFMTAKYQVVTYSKYDFLYEIANDNPYNSKYFLWLNAGTFTQDPGFDYTKEWPDPYKLQLLEDKFLIPGQNFITTDKTSLKDKKSYLRSYQNYISSYILGGTKIAIDNIYSQFWNEVEIGLRLGAINNENHILQLMILERPTNYYLWYHTRYQYPKVPIPLCNRMIPYELALGMFIGEHYYKNPNIKLLTVATKEFSSSSFQRWEKTAIHYGYNYEVIGRNWTGYNNKIRIYYEKLKTVSEPYSILTDCIDLFFCGSSTELYNKFIHLNTDIVIGGERELNYHNDLKHDIIKIDTFFNNNNKDNKESRYIFPNSGFIMGKTEKLINLLEQNIDSEDDQKAYVDTMYENKMEIMIDYSTSLVANIPNYQKEYDNQFQFDPIRGRYMNITNKEIPIALHFPGKNWHQMNDFYVLSQPDIVVQQSTVTNTTGWIFLWLIIVIIIIIVLAFFFRK